MNDPVRRAPLRISGGKPVFRSDHRTLLTGRWSGGRLEPLGGRWNGDQGRAVFVFSGLADNAAFRDAVAALGGRVAGYRGFPDHHPYSPRDLAGIDTAARGCGVRVMVTTAKDAVRLPPDPFTGMELLVADAQMVFIGDDFDRYVRQALALT